MNSDLRSSEVCDALDELGLRAGVIEPGLMALSGDATANGPAYPLRVTPAPAGAPTPGMRLRDLIEAMPLDSVLVIEASAVAFATWGELMTSVALTRGVRGVVCTGRVRDVSEASKRVPIFAAGISPLRAANRHDLLVTAQPVAIGAVLIQLQDHVYADRDGIVVVPATDAGAVAAVAWAIREREKRECRYAVRPHECGRTGRINGLSDELPVPRGD